jgi:serine/threonine protein kinase
VVFDREKTGFEETKDFPIVINSIIAGRYQVVEYLGSAAFSKAIQCYDIHSEQMVCMKIIENNKDYFDQSIDEIKLLRFIISNCDDLDEKNLLKVIDYFYHKEHLFIVTELLRDNLYEYSKYNREVEKKHYFDIPRLQKITK